MDLFKPCGQTIPIYYQKLKPQSPFKPCFPGRSIHIIYIYVWVESKLKQVLEPEDQF